MATLTVGSGQQFQTIAAAVAASHDGDVVQIQAGTYVNDFAEIKTKITLEGVGGLAHLVATTSPPNGKAILVTDTDIHLDHLELSGAAVGDGNAAGIRYQGGNLTVTNSSIHNNQDGILAAADPNGSITIDRSEIASNGTGDGRTHNLYIGNIASFTLTNSYVHDAIVGHEVKSRAATNTITGNRIQNNTAGTASYLVDFAQGGTATVSNNVLQKGPNAQNPVFVSFGEEGSSYANPSLTVSNNTIVSDLAAHSPIIVANDTPGPAALSGNSLWGVAASAEVGTVSTTGNTILSTRPALDTTSPGGSGPSGGNTPVTPTPSTATVPPFDFAGNGAVTPSGSVLIVGQGKQFTTIADAVNGAKNGDTIQIDAGTYVNNGAYINKKLILEGVGGTVKIVSNDGYPLWHQAIFITDADVTLKNFDLSGAHIADSDGGNAAGVRMHSGNLALIDVAIHDNQEGVYATPDQPGGSVTLVNSEIFNNGNASGQYAGQTHNVSVGSLTALAIVDSSIHDAIGGDEVKSRSAQTIISGSRIGDGATGGGGFAVDLPNAGMAVIANSLIQKGPNGSAGAMISYGQDGTPNGGKLQLFNDILSNEGGAATIGVANPHGATVDISASSVWNLSAAHVAAGGGTVSALGTLSIEPDFSATTALGGNVSGVYRFFDTLSGTHFLTGSTSEAVTLLLDRPDLTFEGLGLSAAAPPAQDPNAAPVYRFFDTNNGTHFFTASAAERDQVQASRPDLVREQTSFYEHAAAMPGDVAVYRFFDTGNGTHFYTDSVSERTNIDATRTDLKDEGVAFYSPLPV